MIVELQAIIQAEREAARELEAANPRDTFVDFVLPEDEVPGLTHPEVT